jgi:hypothetical protein
VEIEASWRDSRHGEKLFVERKSSWRDFSVERSAPRREVVGFAQGGLSLAQPLHDGGLIPGPRYMSAFSG